MRQGWGIEPTTTGLTDQKKLLLASCTSRIYYALYPTELPWHIRAEGRTRTSDTQFPYLKIAVCVIYTTHFISAALPTELLPRVYYVLSSTADNINRALRKTAFRELRNRTAS